MPRIPCNDTHRRIVIYSAFNDILEFQRKISMLHGRSTQMCLPETKQGTEYVVHPYHLGHVVVERGRAAWRGLFRREFL